MGIHRFAVAMCVLAAALAAQGETKTWTGGEANWHTDGQWSPSGVPTATDDAIVNSGAAELTSSGNPPVTYVGSATITDVARLVVENQKLQVAGEFSVGDRSGGVAQIEIANAEIECHSYYQSAGSELLFTTGTLTVNGGDFLTAGTRLTIGGQMGVATLSLIGNPDWMVTYEEVDIAPGDDTRGRLELRDGRMMDIDSLTINEMGSGGGSLLISGGILDVESEALIVGIQQTSVTIERNGKCLLAGSVEIAGNVDIAVRDAGSSLDLSAWPQPTELSARSLTVENGGQAIVQQELALGGGITITLNGGDDGEGKLTITDLLLPSETTLTGNGGRVVGNVTSSGHVSPGNSAGTLTIEGDYTQNSGGKLTIEIASAPADGSFDQLVVTGAADLDGTLELNFSAFSTPDIGATYDFLSADSFSGAFSTLDVVGLDTSRQLSYDMQSGSFTVVPEPATLCLLLAGLATCMKRRK